MGLFRKDTISVKNLLAYFEQNMPMPPIIDIRPDDEFAEYHIKNSINLPLSEWEIHGKAFCAKADKTEEIIVVCNMGIKSYQVQTNLVKRGFKNAKVLKNGISAWYDIRAKTRTYSVFENA